MHVMICFDDSRVSRDKSQKIFDNQGQSYWVYIIPNAVMHKAGNDAPMALFVLQIMLEPTLMKGLTVVVKPRHISTSQSPHFPFYSPFHLRDRRENIYPMTPRTVKPSPTCRLGCLHPYINGSVSLITRTMPDGRSGWILTW